jgi:hypothetical protein
MTNPRLMIKRKSRLLRFARNDNGNNVCIRRLPQKAEAFLAMIKVARSEATKQPSFYPKYDCHCDPEISGEATG